MVVSAVIAGYYSYKVFIDSDKQSLLIGEASYGHYQIQLACSACHSEAFGGPELIQAACMDCHKDELNEAHDSHPKKKFNDPRNADLLNILDARYCVSCHTEHQKEQTRAMGLTKPLDYCFNCHEDIGDDRPSHQGLAFNSCASAGCHNYHDNRALYEDFLLENSSVPWLKTIAHINLGNSANSSAISAAASAAKNIDPAVNQRVTDKITDYPDIHAEWLQSAHAEIQDIRPHEDDGKNPSKINVKCGGCHSGDNDQWLEKPGVEQCKNCHRQEAAGFLQGKHGMRLAHGLPSITPGDSALTMKAAEKNTPHSCVACHGAHEFNTLRAAKDNCLSCHDDEHSLAFEQSPHGQLFVQAGKGEIAVEQSVSCASCHMPRVAQRINATDAGASPMTVEHNQNLNLRPNEKMIRPVCMQCHSLEFSIDALADDALIKNNFSGRPSVHIPSIDWVLKREKSSEGKK